MSGSLEERPLQIAVQTHGQADQAAEARLVTTLEHTSGIVSVTEQPVNAAQGVSEIIAVPSTSPQAAATSDLIGHLRADVIPQAEQGSTMKAYVGGTTASNDDFASLVTSKLPLFIAVIAVLGLVLLVIAFRSLLIPLLGAVLNVLSIGVAFGTTVLVFQDGFGVSLLVRRRPGHRRVRHRPVGRHRPGRTAHPHGGGARAHAPVRPGELRRSPSGYSSPRSRPRPTPTAR